MTSIRTKVKPPSSSSATVSAVGGFAVNLAWTPVASAWPSSYYVIYRDGEELATGITGTTYRDATAFEGQDYEYRIATVNVNAVESVTGPLLTVNVPSFPVWQTGWSFSADQNTTTDIASRASDPDGGSLTFSKAGGTAPGTVTVSSAGVVSVGATAGGSYTIILRATNAALSSDFTANMTVTVPITVPGNPINFLAVAASETAISLSWQQAGSGAVPTSYELDRSLNGSTGWVTISSALVTSYSDSGLTTNTQYFYRVRAFNLTVPSVGYATANATLTTASTQWPTQGAVSYTPIVRNLRGPGVNTPAGSGRTLNVVHTAGQQVTPSRILRVTSLLGSNTQVDSLTPGVTQVDCGTLQYCIERHDSMGGPSTIVFEVSGTIDGGAGTPVYSSLAPLLTIAGATAPSPGIQITRAGFLMRSSDTYVSHLTIRYGTTDVGDLDCMEFVGNDRAENPSGIRRIVCDHMTFMWGDDETFSFAGREYEVTVANSIIAEGAGHDEGTGSGHQFNTLISAGNGILSAATQAPDLFLFYGCLQANSDERQPLNRAVRYAQVNGMSYNWSRRSIDWQPMQPTLAISEAQFLTLVGCNFINGPAWNGSRKPLTSAKVIPFVAGSAYYYSDNRWLKAGGVIQTAATDLVATAEVPAAEGSPTWWPTGLVAETAVNAYNVVLAFVGARPGQRDSVTTRLLNDVTTRTGTLKSFNLSGTGVIAGSTLIGQADIPAYAPNTLAFPVAPPSGGNWYDITATGYTKLEDYLHQREDAVL